MVIGFLAGTSVLGPIALVGGGVGFAVIAGYFALTGNPQKDTQRFREVLKGSLDSAIDAVWAEHEEPLSS